MQRARLFVVATLVLASSGLAFVSARAEGKGETVTYKHGDVECKGYLAMPAGKPKAGILVFPEWWGLTEYPKHRADELAALGYAAFAADMYGNAVTTNDPKKAGELAGAVKGDRKIMRARAAAALEAFKAKVPGVKIAAIGYCFGGTTAIELARSGAELAGVVSFHGGLDSPDPDAGKHIKAKILCCHGGDDGFVPEKDLAAFEEEMRKGGVDWQLVKYGGAVHSFTNPEADKHGIKGIAYNERADKRSWKAMLAFFDEVFGH